MRGRLILILLGLLVAGAGLFAAVVAAGAYYPAHLQIGVLENVVGDSQFLIAGIIAFLIGLFLLALGLRRRKKTQSVSQQTELGGLEISFKAIESMILAACKVKGIKEPSTSIGVTEQGLIIYLKVNAVADTPLPALAEELQGKVKDYVERTAGVSVVEVKVLVENITGETVQK